MKNEINGICCEVNNCKYHEATNKCSAGHIKVGCCNSTAHNVDDTICQTFEECDPCCPDNCEPNCDCNNDNCNQ